MVAALVAVTSGAGLGWIQGGWSPAGAAQGQRVTMFDADPNAQQWRFEPADLTVKAGATVVWHNGGIDGFGTSYWRVPDADLVVVAWTNVMTVAIDPVVPEARVAPEATLALSVPLREPLTRSVPALTVVAPV